MSFIVITGTVDLILEINHIISAHQHEDVLKNEINVQRIHNDRRTLAPHVNLFFWKKTALLDAFFLQEKLSGLQMQSVASTDNNLNYGVELKILLRGSYPEMLDFFERLEKNCLAFALNQFVSIASMDGEILFSLDITLLNVCDKNQQYVFYKHHSSQVLDDYKHAFSIKQMQFIGYFKFLNEIAAVILFPNGQTSSVRVGDRLGKESALIISINTHEMVLQHHQIKKIIYG